MNNNKKGYYYEKQINNFIDNNLNKVSYLWNEIPEIILLHMGIIECNRDMTIMRQEKRNNINDTGIDIIQFDNDKNISKYIIDKILKLDIDEDDNIFDEYKNYINNTEYLEYKNNNELKQLSKLNKLSDLEKLYQLNYSFVQCKNGYENGITIKNLSGFMCWLSIFNEINGYVYYTNKLSNNLLNVIRYKNNYDENKNTILGQLSQLNNLGQLNQTNQTNRIQFIKQEFDEKTTMNLIELENKIEIKKDEFKLDEKKLVYQLETKSKIMDYYKLNNRCIMSMPCGVGKTYISYLISCEFQYVFMITPLRQFSKQLIKKFIDYGNKNKNIIISSDFEGERDIKKISKFIENNNKFLISSTYDSMDIVYKIIEKYPNKFNENTLFIIDEFHNLSKTNIYKDDDYFNKFLTKMDNKYKLLFISATPKLYDIERKENIIIDENDKIKIEYEYDQEILDLESDELESKELESNLESKEIDDLESKVTNDLEIDDSNLEIDDSNLEIDEIDDNDLESIETNNLDNEFINEENIYINKVNVKKMFGPIINKMNFTEAIKNNYICDYRIYIPIIYNEDGKEMINDNSVFIQDIKNLYENNNLVNLENTENTENTNVTNIINKLNKIDEDIKNRCIYLYQALLNFRFKKCIIYCRNTNEIKDMINMMEIIKIYNVVDFNMNYITSKKTSKERDKILDNFRYSNKIELLFSIRILDECIDIIECDSVYLSYVSKNFSIETKNTIRIIQRICRCLRNDEKNPDKFGKIFVYCDKYNQILPVISSLKEYEPDFINKYRFINSVCDRKYNKKIKDTNKKISIRYTIGIKEYNDIHFIDMLNKCEKYIIENNQRPSSNNKNKEIKSLGIFLLQNVRNYKYKINNMKNDNIRNLWENFINKHKLLFMDRIELWNNNLNLVKKYIDKNKMRPSSKSKNNEIKKLGMWLNTQNINYKNNKKIMKEKNIREIYENFIKDYKEYFI